MPLNRFRWIRIVVGAEGSNEDLTALIQDADVRGSSMEIDAIVILMLGRVESHGLPPLVQKVENGYLMMQSRLVGFMLCVHKI